MSKSKYVLVAVALSGCLCWALGNTSAEPRDVSPSTGAKPSESLAATETPPLTPSDASAEVVTSIAKSLEAMDPSVTVHHIKQADSSRILDATGIIRATAQDEAESRVGVACDNTGYNNDLPFGAPFIWIFGGPSPNDNTVDDCTLPQASPYKFVCACQVKTTGANRLGGEQTYNLQQQIWSDCVEDAGATLYAQGSFLAIPNDNLERITTITVNPPILDPDNTFWVLVRSSNVDASMIIVNDTTEAGDLGSTLNLFGILDGVGDCSNNLFLFGAPTWAGFPIRLLASVGPNGSCCNVDTATCTNGVTLGQCYELLSYNFETDPGWTVSGTATAGTWQRTVPILCGTPRGDPANDSDGSGTCWITQNNASPFSCETDVDGGETVLTSQSIDVTGIADPRVSYSRWYSNMATGFPNPQSDTMVIEVSSNGGGAWSTLETVGPTLNQQISTQRVNGGWNVVSYRIADFVAVTNQFRIRFRVSDTGGDSNIEAGVDAFRILANPLAVSWKTNDCSNRPDCTNCQVSNCPVGQVNPATNVEAEPDCSVNWGAPHGDLGGVVNRGCQNLTLRSLARMWTPLNCGQTGCGRTGTYTFLNNFTTGGGTPSSISENRRDDDHYLISLTQDTRVTWTVRGKFPSQAIISFTARQTNGHVPLGEGAFNCPTLIATGLGDNSVEDGIVCEDAVATVCLPGRNTSEGPFRYFLRARPSVTKLTDEDAYCGVPYNFNLSCQPCSIPTGACCVDGNFTEGGATCLIMSRLACLIQTGSDTNFYRGDGTNCGSANCPPIPPNDTCATATNLTGGSACSSCVIPYDNTYAKSEGVSIGQGGEVFKDVWYQYAIPTAAAGSQYAGCTSGRLTVSTVGVCYNSKVQMLRMAAGCTDACTGTYPANGRTSLDQIMLIAGPPRVNIGFHSYGFNIGVAAAAGQCYKIRVGGLTEISDFGPGVLRIDYVCQTPTNALNYGWTSNGPGRCCIWDATNHTNAACFITPIVDPNTPLADTQRCCFSLGGVYAGMPRGFRNRTDHYEGEPSPVQGTTEVFAVGCSTLNNPCPAEGEACYNAWDLNALLTETGQGSGFGTITRLVKNKLYFKYHIPASTPIGSGIVINSCNSTRDADRPGVFGLDTAMAVYRGYDFTTGECVNPGGVGTLSGSECGTNANKPFDSREIMRGDDCSATDESAAALTAQGRVSCYQAGEINACLCLKVISSGGSPGVNEVKQDSDIYIGYGVKNTLSASNRPFLDYIRNDVCTTPRAMQVQVINSASCFECTLANPGGTTPEGENLGDCTGTGDGYIDQYNAGCDAEAVLFQNFIDVTLPPCPGSVTYAATSATYRINKVCTADPDCDLGDTCVSGRCDGPLDNSQDYDWYRLTVTAPTRLTWTITSSFPATAKIIASPGSQASGPEIVNCGDGVILSNVVSILQCAETVAEADVCGGVVYLSVVPSNETGVPCGSTYYAKLECGAPSTSAAGCCKGDIDANGIPQGKDIRPFIDWLLGLNLTNDLNPSLGCFATATCRADCNNDFQVTMADIPGFVTALLQTTCGQTGCGSSDDQSACHRVSGDGVGVVSDQNAEPGVFGGGFRAVDDFRVSNSTNQTVSRLCWDGFYFNYGAVIGGNPGNQNPDTTDKFTVTVYNDAGGLPGAPLALATRVTPNNVIRTDTGVDLNYLARSVRRFHYTADLPSSLTLNADACYWLEIVNDTDTAPMPGVLGGTYLWHWETSRDGNGQAAAKAFDSTDTVTPDVGIDNYYTFDLYPQDFAFCVLGPSGNSTIRIDEEDCGLPLGRCCVYDTAPCVAGTALSVGGACSIQTKAYCENILLGIWTGGIDNCTSDPCPFLPCNDECANAFLITSGPVYTNSTNFASKDGPAMQCEQSCGGQCNAAPDVWYKWVACNTNQVQFMMCSITEDPTNYPASLFRFDSMMVIYDGCPITGGTQITGGCNDDACGASGTNSRVTIIAGGITANKTYWIRVSGWSGNFGNFPLKVVQDGCQLPAAVNPSPTNGATGVATGASLSWSAVGGATGYDVYLGTVNPPVSLVSSNQAGTSYNPGGLLNNTTYFWRVDVRKAGGYVTTGSTWSFTTVP